MDLKGVPADLYSYQGLSFISSTTGKFVKLHPNTEKCIRLDMARVLVEVNLHKPLLENICFPDKDGNQITVTVSYPWLPPRCNLCSQWGHLGKDCSKTVVILSVDKATQIQSQIEKSTATDFAQKLLQDLEKSQHYQHTPLVVRDDTGPTEEEGILTQIIHLTT